MSKWQTNSLFRGEHHNLIQHGQGKEYSSDGFYTGEWQNGLKHGTGTEIKTDGSYYKGQWSKNQKHGDAAIDFSGPDNASYSGSVSQGKLDGYGFYKSKAIIYEGEFKHDSKEGEGTLLNPDGTFEYHGNWKKGIRHGNGIRQYQDGSEYVGSFFNNKKHGKGKETYSNEDIYEGQFQNDMRHGKGTYTWRNG